MSFGEKRNVVLKTTNDPDENIFNNSSQRDAVFYAAVKVAASLKKVNDKIFPVLRFNGRGLTQKFECHKKVICLTETWCTSDPKKRNI